jgi:Pyruvate/2-oxoacid:ferredoxin oxidoreductase delta subunit
MQVTILTFSITGNTKLTAKRIAVKLTEANHTVTSFSLVKLGQQLDSLGAASSPLISEVRTSISNSDVVAIGAFSNTVHPSAKVNHVLEDAIFPPSLFTKMKYFFVFATAGQKFGRTLNVLATILIDKNPSAKYLGSLSVLAPENWPPLQPERPYRDAWRASELTHTDEFGAQIARFLDGSEPLPVISFPKTYPLRFVTEKGLFRSWMSPKPVCTREKCQKCGKCVQKCPANAIRISSDIEEGFPVFDLKKCEGCGRCFNLCPAEAIELPNCRTKTRSRYPKPNLVPPGGKCEDGMISQPFPQGFALNKRNVIGVQFPKVISFAVLLIVIAIAYFLKRK